MVFVGHKMNVILDFHSGLMYRHKCAYAIEEVLFIFKFIRISYNTLEITNQTFC